VTDEVKFTDAQWDELARAAEAFANVLERERIRLKDVLVKNWAGECGEGLGTFENLRHLVQNDESGSFGQAIASEAQYLMSLAAQIRNAKSSLVTEDNAGSSQFRNVR
jgi:hypothetical protein